MDPRRIAAGAILCAALLVVVLNSSVSSCVPNDFGKCEKMRERVRVGWLGGGGKSYATLVLADNQNTLKENLLQFANLKRRGGRDADIVSPFAVVSPLAVRHTPAVLPLFKLSEVELNRAEARTLANARDESLMLSYRLQSIANERQRRVKARALELARKLRAATPKKVAVAQPAPVAPQPGSADPYNAPAPPGAWMYIAPHASVWFAADDRGRRLSLLMDADRNLGLVMSVYGPDVQDVWNARPTGVGAPGSGYPYFWTGRSRFKGTWRIRITNPNDFSVPYNLISANIADKGGDLCRDCHGIIEDEWERCEHDGSFCEDLVDDYRN